MGQYPSNFGTRDEDFSLEKIIDELNSKVTSYGGEIVSVRFSNLQEVFPFIQNFPEPSGSRFGKGESGLHQSLPTSVMDELMVGAILSPFAFSNLRCKVRRIISCSDASEHGGAAAEACHFSSALCPETCSFADDWKSSLAEESYNIHVHKSKDVLSSVLGKNLLLGIGLFAQENAGTCSVLLDACKLIVAMTVVLKTQAS